IAVPWGTLLLSVVLYVVVPLVAGILTRRILLAKPHGLEDFDRKTKPLSMVGLLATLVILFALQAQTILDEPTSIALIAVPLVIQSYGIFAIAYGWGYLWHLPHQIAAPAALIG